MDVEDGRERDPRHPEELGREPGAHLPGADEADAERSACLLEALLEPVAVAHRVLGSSFDARRDE